MKPALLLIVLLASAASVQGNPEVATIIDQEYGAATSEGILLLQSPASAAEPEQWTVYARDPFRQGELVRALLTLDKEGWAPAANGAGTKLLQRVPTQPIAFNRVKLRSADVRKIAQQTAMLAKMNFVTAAYQLAANATTGAPEWGLALNDTNGAEIGFIVISAETGAVIHQQWGNDADGTDAAAPGGTKGERAAVEVKKTARRAWEWTGDAGLETGRFFKKLFSRD
ncbi:MAG: hypothetical protein ACKVY0_01510 [Prosthecobacter sp.]|uniref:hypothetical protein n=1 Tax=Prosthecobacter sp. TaxID=1965333 RepID=UPI0039011B3D